MPRGECGAGASRREIVPASAATSLAPGTANDDVEAVGIDEPQVGELGVRVKVERIRRGRRLPDIEYVETRSPRRSADKQEHESSRVDKRAGQADQAYSGLRLPWRINHRPE